MNRVRRNDGFTLVELLVVIAIIGVLAVALLPAIGLVRGESDKLADSRNLEKLYQYASAAAQNSAFPFSKKEGATSVDHFNVMLKDRGVRKNIRPALFVSPVQQQLVADVDGDGNFKLSVNTVSYTWNKRPVRASMTKVPLSSNSAMAIGESQEGHPGGVQVLFPDGTVEFAKLGEDRGDSILKGFIFPQELVDAEGKGPDKIPADAVIPEE